MLLPKIQHLKCLAFTKSWSGNKKVLWPSQSKWDCNTSHNAPITFRLRKLYSSPSQIQFSIQNSLSCSGAPSRIFLFFVFLIFTYDKYLYIFTSFCTAATQRERFGAAPLNTWHITLEHSTPIRYFFSSPIPIFFFPFQLLMETASRVTAATYCRMFHCNFTALS